MERLGVGREAEVFAVSQSECVKLFYQNCPMAQVRAEAERLTFVHTHGVPSPACYGTVQIDGRFGVRMERLQGETLLRRSLRVPPAQAAELPYTLGTLQKAYHQISATGLGDMTQMLSAGIGYTDLLTDAQKDALRTRLARMPAGDRLVHMDYHADNVLITEQGAKIIDWSGACAGNPLADAARTLLTMENRSYPPDADAQTRRTMDDSRAFARARYLEGYGADAHDIAAWTPLIAAARLFCCPEEERAQNLERVYAYLEMPDA